MSRFDDEKLKRIEMEIHEKGCKIYDQNIGIIWDELYGGMEEAELYDVVYRIIKSEDIYVWSRVIAHILFIIAKPHSKYIHLLDSLFDSDNGYYTHLIEPHQELGKKKPSEAYQIFTELKSRDDINSLIIAGAILYGLSSVKPALPYKLIKSETSIQNKNDLIWILEFIRYALYDASNLMEEEAFYVNIFENALSNIDERRICYNLISSLLYFEKFNSNYAHKKIFELCESNDDIRYQIIFELIRHDHIDGDFRLNVIDLCLENTTNSHIIKEGLHMIPHAGFENNIEISMNIILKNLKIDGFRVYEAEYALSKLGEVNFKKCAGIVKSWIIETKFNRSILFHVPHLLGSLGNKNVASLVNLLVEFLNNGSNWKIMAVKTIKRMYSEKSIAQQIDTEMQSKIHESIIKAGEADGFDIKWEIRKASNEIEEILFLVEAIVQGRKDVDWNKILTNFQSYPTLYNFITERKIEEICKKSDTRHPIILFVEMASAEPESIISHVEGATDDERSSINYDVIQMYRFTKTLIDIESKIKKLNEITDGHRMVTIRNSFMNPDQYYSALDEIDMAISLSRNYSILLSPILQTSDGKKELDIEIKSRERKILIEVVSPEIGKNIRLYDGAQIIRQRAVVEKVKEEYRQHLKDAILPEDVPILIAIDTSNSFITDDEFESLLFGELCLEEIRDENGKYIDSQLKRTESIFDVEPEFQVISGVVQLGIRWSSEYKNKEPPYGILYPNMNSKYPIHPYDIVLIQDALSSYSK